MFLYALWITCVYLLNILFLINFIKYLVYRYAIDNKYVYYIY